MNFSSQILLLCLCSCSVQQPLWIPGYKQGLLCSCVKIAVAVPYIAFWINNKKQNRALAYPCPPQPLAGDAGDASPPSLWQGAQAPALQLQSKRDW